LLHKIYYGKNNDEVESIDILGVFLGFQDLSKEEKKTTNRLSCYDYVMWLKRGEGSGGHNVGERFSKKDFDKIDELIVMPAGALVAEDYYRGLCPDKKLTWQIGSIIAAILFFFVTIFFKLNSTVQVNNNINIPAQKQTP